MFNLNKGRQFLSSFSSIMGAEGLNIPSLRDYIIPQLFLPFWHNFSAILAYVYKSLYICICNHKFIHICNILIYNCMIKKLAIDKNDPWWVIALKVVAYLIQLILAGGAGAALS